MKSVEYLLVLVLVLSACGSNNPGATGGGSCPAVAPCGGDIVGTWHFKSTCIESTLKDAGGPCTVRTNLSPTMGSDFRATYTFGANGTFAESASGSEAWTNLQYPGVACTHSDASAAQYCDDLQQGISNAFAAATDAGVTPFKSIGFTCTASGNEVCKCDESITYPSYTIEGTYTTNGDSITIVVTGSSLPAFAGGDAGTSTPTPYCVSGNTLTLGPTTGSSVRGVFVLSR